jgi:hypothetical protein
MNSRKLAGKVVVITGGTRALGRARRKGFRPPQTLALASPLISLAPCENVTSRAEARLRPC